MNISYLAFIRLPNEKAHGIQVMKVCEAFGKAGASPTLILPGRKTHILTEPFSYYGVDKVFAIYVKKVPDFIRFGKVGFVLSQILFSLRTMFFCKTADFIVSQDEWVLLWHVLLGRKCVYEVHNGRNNFAARIVRKKAVLVVANSHGTKQYYLNKGVDSSKLVVFPNGVDIEKFSIPASQDIVRRELNLPKEKYIVLYTGHLYDWKGADTLAKSASLLPEDVLVVFVGGTELDIVEFKKLYTDSKILFIGHRPNTEIPLYLRAADVLALPNNNMGESERFTSPMKLFEYLAAEKPIIASDLPSVREILNERNAFFFTPGEPAALASAIEYMKENTEISNTLARQARLDAEKYTWNRSNLMSLLSEIK